MPLTTRWSRPGQPVFAWRDTGLGLARRLISTPLGSSPAPGAATCR
jgi:hypothetical protein